MKTPSTALLRSFYAYQRQRGWERLVRKAKKIIDGYEALVERKELERELSKARIPKARYRKMFLTRLKRKANESFYYLLCQADPAGVIADRKFVKSQKARLSRSRRNNDPDYLERKRLKNVLHAARVKKRMANDPEYAELVRARDRERKKLKRQTDPEHRRRHNALVTKNTLERRHKIKVSSSSEAVDRHKVYELHNGLCYLCGSKCSVMDFHMDHVIPLSRGGDHIYANCRPTHPFCNMKKGDKLPLIAMMQTT